MLDNAKKFYIDGKWQEPNSQAVLPVVNPATEEIVGEIAAGNEADIDLAVSAAKKAFASFGHTQAQERKAILIKLLEIYNKRKNDIAVAVAAELGAPIDFALSDQVGAGSWHLQGFIDAMDKIQWDGEIWNGDRVRREPIGVVGCITPWNWPLNQIALKVFGAIAAGSTVVLKPSELTPYNAILFAEIIDEAGVPDGVFNMVHGLGPIVGSALSKHKDVDMMSFTGSTRAGAFVSADSAPFVKRVALELGGKSPNLVFADVENLDQSVRSGVAHMMENTGQSCNAPSRMIVESSAYEDAIKIAANEANNTQILNPQESGAGMGPLVSELQFEKVQNLIANAIDEGARLVAGGLGRPEGFNRGYYVRPTVFADVTPDMTIWREEVFGPVLVMTSFEGEEEAIALANDTDYGLAAYVNTSSSERAERVIKRIRAGMVRVNGRGLACGSPFGGFKQSGNGREGGIHGIEDFQEIKLITRPDGFIA